MCKITWETDYKLALIRTFLSAVVGTVALASGRNVAGCSPLWGWTVAVVVISYIGFCSTSTNDGEKTREKMRKMNLQSLICAALMWFFPTIVLFIMSLVVLADTECREKWESRNALLLYYAVVNGVVWCTLMIIDLFFHECWKKDEVPPPQVGGNNRHHTVEVYNNSPSITPPLRPPASAPRMELPYQTGGDLYAYGDGGNPHYIDEEGR